MLTRVENSRITNYKITNFLRIYYIIIQEVNSLNVLIFYNFYCLRDPGYNIINYNYYLESDLLRPYTIWNFISKKCVFQERTGLRCFSVLLLLILALHSK